jgi:RNA polymerase sigma factor (sigma-70 family)
MQSPFPNIHQPHKPSGDLRELVLHPIHLDDLSLWKAFRSGNEKALIIIFDRFTRPLFNYGYKILGERDLVKDCIQELFIEIWQKRERLGDTDSIKLYLYKSLRRKLLRAKAKSEKRFFGSLWPEYNKEVCPSPEFLMISEQVSLEKKETVMILLDKLTKRQREAIFLRYFEELDFGQIAAVMEITRQAVYNLIHHALSEMKKLIHSGYLETRFPKKKIS